MERRCSILGPNQSRISPSILWYTKKNTSLAAPVVDGLAMAPYENLRIFAVSLTDLYCLPAEGRMAPAPARERLTQLSERVTAAQVLSSFFFISLHLTVFFCITLKPRVE